VAVVHHDRVQGCPRLASCEKPGWPILELTEPGHPGWNGAAAGILIPSAAAQTSINPRHKPATVPPLHAQPADYRHQERYNKTRRPWG
jgi:hypothetical protein